MRINNSSQFKMFALVGALLIFGYSVQAQSALPPSSSEIDVISTDTSLVTINISVTDHKNHQPPRLKLEDFRVTDQGRPVHPEFMDSQGPLSIVFLIDVSSSMKGHWQELKSGLKKFLEKESEGSDYTLITFNEKPRLIATSVDAKQLWKSFNTLRPYGETALYDGLILGLQALERLPQRHKALVLLSDGEDNSSQANLAMVEEQTLLTGSTFGRIKSSGAAQTRNAWTPCASMIRERSFFPLNFRRVVTSSIASTKPPMATCPARRFRCD